METNTNTNKGETKMRKKIKKLFRMQYSAVYCPKPSYAMEVYRLMYYTNAGTVRPATLYSN